MKDSLFSESMNGTSLHQCVALYTQRLALQDCVMSNMERFKYIIIVDVDEFIIPSNVKICKYR